MEIEKPFKCSTCNSRFTNEGHLQVHRKRHEMSLNLSKPGGLNLTNNCPDGFVDETPTPTRFIRNCEEVGLFQDLQNQSLINPFDLQFTKAASATPSSENNYEFNFSITSTSKKLRVDDTLNTPQVFGYSIPTTSSSSSSSSNSASIIPSGLLTSSNILSSSCGSVTTTTTASSSVIQNSSVSTAISSSSLSNSTTNHDDNFKIIIKDKRTIDSNSFEKISSSDENQVESTTPDDESFNIPPIFSSNRSSSSNDNSKIQIKKLRLNLNPVENIESSILESSNRLLLSDPILSSTGIHNHDDGGEGMQSIKISYFAEEGVDILKQSHTNHNKKSSSSSKQETTPNLDCDKKTELLERNRAAASRSRERRKQWVSALETRIQSLQNLLSVTQNEVIKLRQENKTLREQLGNHTNSDGVTNRNHTDKSVDEPCQTNETQNQILTHSSSTCVTSKSSINPTIPIPPFPRQLPPTRAKRGRPRKGWEKRVAGINIPSPLNSVPCSISVPKSPAIISPRHILPPRSSESTNHPQVLSSNTNTAPFKVEIVPIQQMSNVFLLKPQIN